MTNFKKIAGLVYVAEETRLVYLWVGVESVSVALKETQYLLRVNSEEIQTLKRSIRHVTSYQ